METPETGRPRPPEHAKRVRLRWDRILMAAAILLAIIAGTIYAIHLATDGTRVGASLPEKPKTDGISQDLLPNCGTNEHPCQNQTCQSGKNCLV